MFTQTPPAEIARFKAPAIPFTQPEADFDIPANARDAFPEITPVGDQQQVHKTKLLEARRRRRKRLAGRR